MIKCIAHVCIGSTDLAASERFYTEGLGFTKIFDFIKGGAVIGFYLQVSPSNYVEVFRQDTVDLKAPSAIRHMCLEVDDLDATCRHLASRGYEVGEKKLGADQSWQAWTSDPSGVRIEFHQYTPKSSQRTHANCIL